MSLTLIPAYGRTFKNADAARNDWHSGKDWKIYGGPYTSVRDASDLLSEYGPLSLVWDYPASDSVTTAAIITVA